MKKPLCPIGLECIVDFGQCPNYHYCLNQTYSWAIPYTYQDNVLAVRCFPYRFRWTKEATGISHKLPGQCWLPSGSYDEIEYPRWEFEEMVRRILEEWEKAGWKEAEPIPNLENEHGHDINIDDIF